MGLSGVGPTAASSPPGPLPPPQKLLFLNPLLTHMNPFSTLGPFMVKWRRKNEFLVKPDFSRFLPVVKTGSREEAP